jgi:hypothetical protein
LVLEFGLLIVQIVSCDLIVYSIMNTIFLTRRLLEKKHTTTKMSVDFLFFFFFLLLLLSDWIIDPSIEKKKNWKWMDWMTQHRAPYTYMLYWIDMIWNLKKKKKKKKQMCYGCFIVALKVIVPADLTWNFSISCYNSFFFWLLLI